MDLTLFFRVVWRYRLLVLAGFTLALLIAFFAAFRITPGGEKLLTLRGEGQYSSATTIFVTQQGFPWGRLPEDDPNGGSQAAEDSGRLAGLATLYAKLVDSDPVTDAAKRQLPATGWLIEAAPVLDGAGLSSPLPLISVIAVANSPELAEKAVGVTTSSLLTYVSDRQNEASIPADERVVLQRIKGPTEPLTVKGRSFTFPIVLFLLFLDADAGGAVHPRQHPPVGLRRPGRGRSAGTPRDPPPPRPVGRGDGGGLRVRRRGAPAAHGRGRRGAPPEDRGAQGVLGLVARPGPGGDAGS